MKLYVVFLGALMCGANVAMDNLGIAALNFVMVCFMGIVYQNILEAEKDEKDN